MDELDALYDQQGKQPSPAGSGPEDDDEGPAFTRRQIVLGVLVAVVLLTGGLVSGWVLGRSRSIAEDRAHRPPMKGLDIGLEQYMKTDPKLILYRQTGQINPGFKIVRRVAVGPQDRIYIAGMLVKPEKDKTSAIRVFNADGSPRYEVSLLGVPHCLYVAEDGLLYVVVADRLEVYSAEGKREKQWGGLGTKAYITSIAVTGDSVYLADARNREIVCFDLDGEERFRFGKKDPARNNPGIVVPSPYLDLFIGPDGRLRVINPGRHTIETYTPDGDFVSAWGKPGAAAAGFAGCCNPVYIASLPDGGYVTSEKGLLRIKTYNAHGEFQGVVAGPERLMDAEKTSFRLNKGIDVAVDSAGRVLAADPYIQEVRIFVPNVKTGEAQ